MKNNTISALGLVCLSLVSGCGGGSNNAVTTVPTAHLAITLPTGTVEAGAPFTFTVNALNASNAGVPTYTGTVQIATSDTSATLPANSTLARGTGTFTVTFGTAGSYTITASDTVGNATAGTSAAVSVVSGPVEVFITPAAVALSPAARQVFTGHVVPHGDGTTNFDVTWTVQEGPTGGSITTAGFYTAPSSSGTYHVIATSVANPADSATAIVTVIEGGIATLQTGSMISARGAFTATLLGNGPVATNGKVLVAGGNQMIPATSSSAPSIFGIRGAELYDPATGTFAATGSMNTPRYAHTATLLPDGKVLIAGGLGDGTKRVPATAYPPVLSSFELYDPATGKFTEDVRGALHVPRANHTATLISGGRVLIVGGIQDVTGDGSGGGVPNEGQYPYTGPALETAEIYDIATGGVTQTSSMWMPRFGHTATLLADGTVLIAGGIQSSFGLYFGMSTSTAEIYDPSTAGFLLTGPMHTNRDLHGAILLNNGKVLITGGNQTSPSAEIFDPATGVFSLTGNMAVPRSAHTATQLGNGQILVAGGATTPQCVQSYACGVTAIMELFDPTNGTFTPVGVMHIGRSAHTATLLSGGEVLLAGGEGEVTAELYP